MEKDDDNGAADAETQVVTTTITGDNNGIKSCLLLSYADLRSCQSSTVVGNDDDVILRMTAQTISVAVLLVEEVVCSISS